MSENINIDKVKEKIKNILESEKTNEFLNNITSPSRRKKARRGITISKQELINCFLEHVFYDDDDDDEDIYIEDFDRHNITNNLIIYGKRIAIKSLSDKSARFSFNSFAYRDSDDFDIIKNLEETLEKVKRYDYVLLIEIYRSIPNDSFEVLYNFYLVDMKNFYFDVRNYKKTKCGFVGKNWFIQSNKEFYFRVNSYFGDSIFSYSFNHE